MGNVFLEKLASDNDRTSTEKTFVLSEGLGIASGLAGGLIGGRLGSKALGKAIAAKPISQKIGRVLFGKDAILTGTHMGSEIGAHVIGAAGSYGALKGIEKYDTYRKNKYLQKAASLFEQH